VERDHFPDRALVFDDEDFVAAHCQDSGSDGRFRRRSMLAGPCKKRITSVEYYSSVTLKARDFSFNRIMRYSFIATE
jgi:uncharacterized CHY-type Zn-finger protein